MNLTKIYLWYLQYESDLLLQLLQKLLLTVGAEQADEDDEDVEQCPRRIAVELEPDEGRQARVPAANGAVLM